MNLPETSGGLKFFRNNFEKPLHKSCMCFNTRSILINNLLFLFQCLETCVKNCGRRFHIQVANKDFLNDIVKVIGPKYDPPQALQEKVLSMIQVGSQRI